MLVIKLTTVWVFAIMSIITQDEITACGELNIPFNKSTIMETKPWSCTLRLSPYVHPDQYVLFINPNIDNQSFSGYVEITLTLDTPQSYIKLHANELNISETTLDSNPVTAFSYPEYQFWVVVPDNELNAGTYKLRLQFNGCLLNRMKGFYRSVYFDVDTKEQIFIATTQFETTDARSAFPCFDEPQLKSKFKISITRPSNKNFIALSNMNQEGEEVISLASGLTIVHFANTLPMSTYLVSFIVCDFQSIESVKVDQRFTIRVFARRGQHLKMKYARFIALKSINFYAEYFGIEYPLPKLDLIAIPDFEAGGMENWGLITFRENNVLYSEYTSSNFNKEKVAKTVSHELAHMWFGDLVTMKWWNDLWLKEGFATYMTIKAIEAIHPDWDYDAIFKYSILHNVLDLDNKISSHPIVQDVCNPDEINSIFDNISYYKGAAILRMLEGMLGNIVFRTGINAYLTKYQFSNAQTDDLWYELQIASQNITNIRKVMYTWIHQTGFPLVSAIRDGNKLTLKQKRFLIDPNVTYSLDLSPFKYKWEIPLTYITSENITTVHKCWLCSHQDSVTIDVPNVEWIKINYRQNGYYIVNYSNNDWNLFIKLLQKNINAFNVADRANLLYDAFSLAEATYLPYEIPLDMTRYLISEFHFIPWNVAYSRFYYLWFKLYDRPAGPQYEKYLHKLLLEGIKEDLWDDSINRTYFQNKLRPLKLKLGGLVNIPNYRKKMNEILRKFLVEKIPINIDIKFVVFRYGIAYGDVNDWNKVWDLYLKEEDPQLRLYFLDALTYSTDISLLTRLLQYAKNEKYVRSQDFFDLLTSLCKNPLGNQLVWNFIRNEWMYLVNRFSLNNIYLGVTILNTCQYFQTQQRLNEMKAYFEKYPDIGAGKSYQKMALETVLNNIQWLERNEASVTNWLKNYNQ